MYDNALTKYTAQTPVAIDVAGIPHLSTRQPRALVPGRSLKIWLPSLHARRPCGDSHCLWSQPRDSTLTSGSIATSGCNEYVS